ncbi:AraC family transcriptional regulator [Halalkalibaculum sp. DA384]|uniref:AraC family transcriptional regulator n=1 Tax=Halalkalibaculum sp. DA384 TaxID=3373606 RepID=UPI003754A02F
MDFLVERILVPEKKSFQITEHDLGSHTSKVHTHCNCELNFIKRGWGRRYVGDNISSFHPGDLVLMGANLPHCWEVKGTYNDKSPKCIVIHFQENLLDSVFTHVPELEPIREMLNKAAQGLHFKGSQIIRVRELMEEMLQLEGLNNLIALLKVFNILLEIEDYEYLSTPGYIKQANQSDFQKVNKIYEYVFKNFQHDISLEEVAELVNITPGSLCRYFKNKTGQTLFEFLKEVRIGYACKLLSVTNKTITEICFESGYNTLAHFNTQFKELKKMTPSEFRKKSKTVLTN